MHDPRHLRSCGASDAVRRRSVLLAAAALLAVALIAGVYSLAHALPGPREASRASSASDAGAGGPAIDADLDSALEAVVAANSQYRVGVALMDTVGGQPHQYGVGEPFEAASTAEVLAAAAYYSLVQDGSASLDDQLGAFTSGFQIQAMIQDSNNHSCSGSGGRDRVPQIRAPRRRTPRRSHPFNVSGELSAGGLYQGHRLG
jgi:beta-lactamase class A